MPRLQAHVGRLLLLALAGAASAQSQRISGELAHTPPTLGGDVLEVFFSPDGSRVLYLADEDVTGRLDLYSLPADGSAPSVRLSESAPGSLSEPLEHRFTPSRIVFRRSGLYSAPLDGSAPALALTSPFVRSWELTPDGETVVWLDGESPFSESVLARPSDGSAPATTLVPDTNFVDLDVAPNGERIVVAEFVECFPTGDPYEVICTSSLLSLPLDGSQAPVTLNPGLPSLREHAITPDSSLVVFAALAGADMVLYRVPLDGSAAPVAFTGAIPFSSIELTVSPGGERVVYLDDAGELYSVPIDGSAAPARLNGNLVDGGSVLSFQIAPDGTRVVYLADQQVLGQLELYRVPIEDGFAVKLSGPMAAGGDVVDYRIAPDSVGVVFRADRLEDQVFELFAVPFSGGVVRLNPPAEPGGDVESFQISMDCTRVAYRASLEQSSRDELFSVPITGGASTKLNGPLVSDGDVHPSYAVSPDSSRAAYVADELVDQIDEAFVAPLAGGPSVRVNGLLDFGPPSGDVTTYAALPGSSGAVYIADGDDEDVFELYRTHIGGSPVTKLSGPLIPEGDVTQVVVTPDGTYVLYLADADRDERFDLFVVPADGSQPAVQLSQPIEWFEDVRSPEVTADGSRVVYVVASASSARLFSVPVSGGAPLQLSPVGGASLYSNGISEFFVLSADGTNVVYRTQVDLFAAPTDGSRPALRLNGRFGPGNVPQNIGFEGRSFQITPDGTRVVYVADPRVNGRFELFSVPIEGGDARLSERLNAPLVPGGDVIQFEIGADSRVVYLADQTVDGRYELFGAVHQEHALTIRPSGPWVQQNGAGRPVKLSGPLVSGGRVGTFHIGPDGTQVAFGAHSTSTGYYELFVAAIDGSERMQLASGNVSGTEPLFASDGERVLFGRVSAPTDGSGPALVLLPSGSQRLISRDGKWVVYRTGNPRVLFAVPIDGSLSPIPVSGPTIPAGDVGGDHDNSTSPMMIVTSDSNHVIFGADQDDDEVFELYAGALPDLP